MRRTAAPQAVCALLASLVAAWPLTSLIELGRWIWPIIVVAAAVSLLGMALRAMRCPGWLIPAVQFLALVVTLALIYLPHTLSIDELVQSVQALIEDGAHTIQTSAPPAPASIGLQVIVAFAVTGFGLITDICAATLRSPVLAGVPLLGVFLISAANTAVGLNPVYFIAVAALWLAMVAVQHAQDLQQGVTGQPLAVQPTPGDSALAGHGRTARLIAVPVILLAAVLPSVIPHAPAHFFADGLARGTGDGPVSIGFSTNLDLSADLNSNNTSPVLTFTTADLTPPPLRVVTSTKYADGSWSADDPSGPATIGADGANLSVPAADSLRRQSTVSTMQVKDSVLGSGLLAAPFPASSADLDGSTWLYVEATGQIRPLRAASRYQVSYLVPTAQARPSGTNQLPTDERRPALAVDARSRSLVLERLEPLRADTQWQTAKNIQNYLRASGGFTYSLTLAATGRGSDGQPLDALSNFLVTKQGYCTQFATAMVMMARASGIPARLAVGFLPGSPTSVDNQRSVLQSDAHAWPELWFPGMGWTRFEPTPGVRATDTPAYTQQDTTTVTRSGQPSERESSSAAASASSSSTATTQTDPAAAAAGSGFNWGPWLRLFGWLAAVLLIGGAGAVVLPLLARRGREAARERERDTERVEAEWQHLVWDLSDLGAETPPADSPRLLERHYRNSLVLTSQGQRALHEAVRTLEQARYADPDRTDGQLDLGEHADQIVRDARRSASATAKLRATLWPRSAFHAIASALPRRGRQSR